MRLSWRRQRTKVHRVKCVNCGEELYSFSGLDNSSYSILYVGETTDGPDFELTGMIIHNVPKESRGLDVIVLP